MFLGMGQSARPVQCQANTRTVRKREPMTPWCNGTLDSAWQKSWPVTDALWQLYSLMRARMCASARFTAVSEGAQGSPARVLTGQPSPDTTL